MAKKVAYDLDGVLSILCKRDKPYSKQNKWEREAFEKIRVDMYANSPLLLIPENNFYVISSRKEKYRNISDGWLIKNKLKYIESFYLKGKRKFDSIKEFKIGKLKELSIDKFYEDDAKLIKEIEKSLPNIEIVQIPRTKVNVKIVSIPDKKVEIF
jgi:uncharacterized HAD superfamily protein